MFKPHLLVIGGTGFIGYHLTLAAIKKGWKVTSVSLNKPKKFRFVEGVRYLKINISNLKQLKEKLNYSFTYVVNLGGYVDHSLSKKKADVIINTHFVGLTNLISVLTNKKIKKFIQIGSSVEYGKIKAPQSESDHCSPKSLYAMSKLASTEFLLMLYNTEKFPATILRFFQIYGPKQDENRILPQIIKSCLKNKKFPTSQGDQIRDFCYVDDSINAIFCALKSKQSDGEIFNIGSGSPTKIKYVIKKVCKIIKKGKPQFGKIKYRKDENMNLSPNIKKARKKLKWKPMVNFTKGIKLVINSFQN